MKYFAFAIVLVWVSLAPAPRADAADNVQATIDMHITPYGSSTCHPNQQGGGMGLTVSRITTAANDGSGCDDGFAGARWQAWLVVCAGSDSTGIRGAEFGIDYNPNPYDGIYVNAWDLCADQDFQEPGWPSTAPSGILVTWIPANCQIVNSEPFVPYTVIAVMGALDIYTYSPDELRIIPRPISGRAEIADCSGDQESILDNIPTHLGTGAWCSGPGYKACWPGLPVKSTTWGRLKRFGD